MREGKSERGDVSKNGRDGVRRVKGVEGCDPRPDVLAETTESYMN